MSNEETQKLLDRQDELDQTAYRTSGFLRIYRGYYTFNELSLFEKIFGANNKVMMERANKKSPISFLFRDNDFYYNTIQNILIKTGIIGAIIFILFTIQLFARANPCGKTIVTTMTLLSFVSSLYLSFIMLIYLIFAEHLRKRKSDD